MSDEKIIIHLYISRSFISSKRAISPVVAMSLLLVVAVISVVGFQGWFNEFSSNVFVDAETLSSKNSNSFAEIEGLIGDSLYVDAGDNLSIKSISIGGINCGINGSFSGISTFDVSNCLKEVLVKSSSVRIITNDGVFEEFVYIDEVSLAGGFKCSNNTIEGFFGGNGSFGNPWQICDCFQLQNIDNYLDGNFSLNNNVDCSMTSLWNSGAGFEPIGGVFNGVLDGSNYGISNLYINRSAENNVGLFSSAYGGSSFSKVSFFNLSLFDVNVSGFDVVGGLLGNNDGYIIIDNVFVSGHIYGDGIVGGMVGR